MAKSRTPKELHAFTELDPVEYAFSFIYANKEFFAAPYCTPLSQFQTWASAIATNEQVNRVATDEKPVTALKQRSIHRYLLTQLSHKLKNAIDHESHWRKLLLGLPGDPASDSLVKSRDDSKQFHDYLRENPKLVETIHSIALTRLPVKLQPIDLQAEDAKQQPLQRHEILLQLTNPIIELWYQQNTEQTVTLDRATCLRNEAATLKRKFSHNIMNDISKQRDKKGVQLVKSLYINIDYYMLLIQTKIALPPELDAVRAKLKSFVDPHAHDEKDIETVFEHFHKALTTFSDSMQFKSINRVVTSDIDNLLNECPPLLDLFYPITRCTTEINDWYAKSAPGEQREERINRVLCLKKQDEDDSDSDNDNDNAEKNNLSDDDSDDDETNKPMRHQPDKKHDEDKQVIAAPALNRLHSSLAPLAEAPPIPTNDEKDFKFIPVTKPTRYKLVARPVVKSKGISHLFWSDPKWQKKFPTHPRALAAIEEAKKRDEKAIVAVAASSASPAPEAATGPGSSAKPSDFKIISQAEFIAQIQAQSGKQPSLFGRSNTGPTDDNNSSAAPIVLSMG